MVVQAWDPALLDQLLSSQHPDTFGALIQVVLHPADHPYVGETSVDPAKYYRNNVGDSFTLFEAPKAQGERRCIRPLLLVSFATCPTYGIPAEDQIPTAETCPQQPINTYGRSKWMVEQAIGDFGLAYGLPSLIFCYCNAAGPYSAEELG